MDAGLINHQRKRVVLDLCCGLGGWSEGFIQCGWDAVGVDIADYRSMYPGQFIHADLLKWDGWLTLQFDLVVASPPCEEFSRWDMPWTRKRNPPVPSLDLVSRCFLIASFKRVPIVLENVRGAQRWLGRSRGNCGPFHLWGDVPAILPIFVLRQKQSLAGSQRAERAKVPLHLSAYVASCFS